MIELQSYVKTAKKEISAMYVRATTEPGFMDPPPEPEYENLALKAFLEKKAAEEKAAEARGKKRKEEEETRRKTEETKKADKMPRLPPNRHKSM